MAPGQRIALTLDIDLQPNIHVYAPGVDNYIPIEWKMEDADLVVAHAPEFPRAEKLYLKAINETVPTYRNQFRLMRDITIPSEDKLSRRWTPAGTSRSLAHCAIKPATIGCVTSRRRCACNGLSSLDTQQRASG